MTKSKSASLRRWGIRAAGSAIVLGILFWLLPMDIIVAAFREIPLSVFMAVLGLFLAVHVGAALKWWILLNFEIPPLVAIRAHFGGLAANLGLPGAIGGDAVRAAFAYARIRDGAKVAVAGGADRLIDLVALFIVSLVGMSSQFGRGVGDSDFALKAGAVFIVMLVALIIGVRCLPLMWKLAPKLPGQGFALKLTTGLAQLVKQPLKLALVLAISTCLQMCLVVLAWWLAQAAGAGVNLGDWMFAWPMAKIIAVLPISLNGLGVREALLASFLTPFGANAALIVGAGLAWQVVMFAAGGIGALFLVLSPPPKDTPVS